MSIRASNPGQNEFAQIFEQLAKEFKMTQADVARSLSIERSYVSMILNGQRKPSRRLLEALRALEVRLGAGDQGGLAEDGELNGVMELLRKLKESDGATFLAVKKVVEALAKTSLKPVNPAANPKRSKHQS